jgi:hypothetical protein
LLKQYYEQDMKQTLTKYLNSSKELINRYDRLDEFNNLDTNGSSSGNNGVLQVLNNTISPIANNEYFNSNEFDIVKNLSKGKIIIINVSGFNNEMLNFLNLSIYNRMIRQTSISAISKPITIFIDEAQKVITAQSMPDVDVCRENNFEFILSTQDQLLLEKQLGSVNMAILLKNIVEQYSFKTTSPQGNKVDTSLLEKEEYANIILDKRYKAEPIYINDDDKFNVEYEYQKLHDISKIVDVDTNERYILKYLEEMHNEQKVIVYFESKYIKIVDIILDTKVLMEQMRIFRKEHRKFNNRRSEYNATRRY